MKNKKIYYFSPKKSKNILFLVGLDRSGGARAPLPSPADVHDHKDKQQGIKKYYSAFLDKDKPLFG
jgi:hypothetical protein